MLDLDQKYLTKLNDIKVSIQHSDELASFLLEEEHELYTPLKDKFEPLIEGLYEDVASSDPLQLISLEKELLHPEFEGLFVPRVLGYAVMRGQINEEAKYVRPQEHFKEILLAICNSANFGVLQARSGKTIEIGFALSSDIWISNLLNEVSNKKVRSYLDSLKLPKYRDDRIRLTAYITYKKQFSNFNYLTAEMPTSCADLSLNGESLITFLLHRAKGGYKNKGIEQFISDLINLCFENCNEYLRLLIVLGMYYDLKSADQKSFKENWTKISSQKGFVETAFRELILIQENDQNLTGEAFDRLNKALDGTVENELNKFIKLIVEVEGLGYINDEAAEKVRSYVNNHEGLSLQNEATRLFILNRFKSFISKLKSEDFHEYFEFNPVFINYMNIFTNEKFNQNLKSELLKYVKTLLRKFTDKRSKDYQDIKKFVQPSFVDMGFMNEKSVKELFKKKRKPVTA
jgi:hypothetical protein